MPRPAARALFLLSATVLALLFVILMVGGLGRLTVVADGTGRSPSLAPPHLNVTPALTTGHAPTLCLTTTNYLTASPQDLNPEFSAFSARTRIQLADVNGDNTMDVIQAGNIGAFTEIWLNDGNGQFQHRQQQLFTGYGASIAVGDIDGNGTPDLITSGDFNYDGASAIRPQTFLNNGSGFFLKGAALPATNLDLSDLDLGDLDGDNDLDVIVVYSSTIRGGQIFWNDGTGQFSPATSTLNTTVAQNITLADLNGDESEDIIIGRNHAEVQLWFNDGDGHFALQPQTLISGFGAAYPALGDVNGDQFVDVVLDFTNVWLNDGKGHFTFQGETSHLLQYAPFYDNDKVLLDVNGDESPDLVQISGAVEFNYAEGFLVTYLNDGRGYFCIANGIRTYAATDLATADLDDDDDLDVVMGLNVYNGIFRSGPFHDGAYQPIWFNRNAVQPIVIGGFSNTGPVPPEANVYIRTNLESGTNVTASWNLGPAGRSYQLNPVFEAPAEAGIYTLYVTLTNELGAVLSQTTIIVDDTMIQSIDLDHSRVAPPATPVLFDFTKEGILVAAISYGDEEYAYNMSYRDLSSLFHFYAATGTYTVTVFGNTLTGWSISQTSRITITDESLSGLSILAPPNLQVNQPAIFTATLAYGQPTSYTWAMGDGTMLNGPVVTHTFTAYGDYTVTLTVTDGLTTLQATLPISLPPPKLFQPILVAAPPPD
ncbi:MAG: VCBS repeat-containing protein [Ardenticatenales bacterium]|nr:VCBS repeat-containing protein [Ardenticatenales bacterium]